MKLHSLSKSRYLSGYQCLKKLYLSKHRPDLMPEISQSQQALFDQGHSVGELAQGVFPGGMDATPDSYYDFGPSVVKSRQWIDDEMPVVYEAAFVHDQVLAALDILVRKDGEIHAIEVKSSTGVKDYHIIDGSLQYWVMSNSGCRPDKFFLMHINNEYVRKGKLEPEQLFHLEDITEEVLERQEEVPIRLEQMKQSLNASEVPEVGIGPHCGNPFPCDFHAHCWQHVPDDSVFTLNRLRSERAWHYYEQGVHAIDDLPEEDPFTNKQRMQIDGVKNGYSHINKPMLADWLEEFEYPLYFLDFETINPGIPLYDGTRPYQQIPVQYSLHIIDEPGAEARHLEFLPSFEEDPRKEMAGRLLKDLGSRGHIIAYNMSFEKRCISLLADTYPEYSDQLHTLNKRLIDLMIPFQKGWYYTPEMKGSYSIKYVLPALVKNENLSYSALSISNGGDASTYLQALAEGKLKPENLERVRKDLLEYCKLDTLAMVEIWHVLKDNCREKNCD